MREYAFGTPAEAPTDTVTSQDEEVRIRVWSDSPTYRPYQQLRLHVRLDLAPGAHVFAPPTPADYQALEFAIEPLEGPAGELYYESGSLALGLAVSALTAALLTIVVGASCVRRRTASS